jgi:integrase
VTESAKWDGNADLANEVFGENYGVDWEYAAQGSSAIPKTVRNHLTLLGLIFRQARKWRWVSENPIELVDKPPADDAETETLTADEVALLIDAYRKLEAAAEKDERWWFEAARRMTVVALSTGLRRGELLGLRWTDVELLDGRLHVRQAFVRGEMSTPKSRAGRRVVQLGRHAAAALEEQYRASRYQAGDCVVFCHPALGMPLDASKLTGYARKAFAKAGIAKPFRPWHGRPPPHGPHRDRRRWSPGDVRAGQSRSRSGLHDGAVPSRDEDRIPRRGRARGGETLPIGQPGGLSNPMAWEITNVESVDTDPDRDTVEAVLVHLERDGATARSTLEYAGTAQAAGVVFDPREAIRPYLDDDEVPRQLIVTSEGIARPAQ